MDSQQWGVLSHAEHSLAGPQRHPCHGYSDTRLVTRFNKYTLWGGEVQVNQTLRNS